MICIAILAHGSDHKQLMFSDGQKIPLPILLHNVMTCEELLGKPKLFLLQACRGSANSFQGNLPISTNSHAIDMENDADTSTNIIRTFQNRHAVVDTAEFWATPPGWDNHLHPIDLIDRIFESRSVSLRKNQCP